MDWILKKFETLTPFELYAVLHLRNEIFVVEQQCVYLDTDGKDLLGMHLMAWHEDALVAYTRLLPPGVSYEEASIGRVVVQQAYRNMGLGKTLMQKSIDAIEKQFGKGSIRIGAQVHLQQFYSSLGFVSTGEIYDEDGINHIEMLRAS